MKYLCLDIEAVVDPSLWTPPPDEPDQFPPAYAWRPICIGMVLLEESRAGIVTRKIGAYEVATFAGADARERLLLEQFRGAVETLGAPCLVTWNGRAYDLPALMLRSLRYGIAHPWYYQSRDTRYRFSEAGHCDLADAMGDYGASRRLHLDGMAKLIGLPGTFGDIDGSKVGEAYAAGRLEEIVGYCISDAVQTAFLFLRWQLLKATITVEGYRAAAYDLLSHCQADGRLHAGFVALVDRGVLLLEQAGEVAA